jgi:hypothetical protein
MYWWLMVSSGVAFVLLSVSLGIQVSTILLTNSESLNSMLTASKFFSVALLVLLAVEASVVQTMLSINIGSQQPANRQF